MLSNAFSAPNLTYFRWNYGQFIVPVDEDGCRSDPCTRLSIYGKERTGHQEVIKETRFMLKTGIWIWNRRRRALERDSSVSLNEHSAFYTIPDIFVNDWIDLYYRKNTEDDFGFV